MVLKKHINIKDFLEEYSEFPAIAVNMRLFGDSGHKKVINDNYSVINRFTYSDDKLFPLVKLFLNFRIGKNQFRLSNPHIVNCKAIDPNKKMFTINGNFPNNTEDEIAELAHFRNKSYEECLKRKFKNTDVCYGYIDKVKNPDSSGRTNLELFNKEYEEHNRNNIENNMVVDFLKRITNGKKDTSIKIFVLTHGNVDHLHRIYSDKTIFTPVCCGAELKKNNIPGVLYDNEGVNISRYNKLMNEATGVFYIGNNIDELAGDSQFIGVMQYSKGFIIPTPDISENTIIAAFLLNGKTTYQKFSGYVYFDRFIKEFSNRLKTNFPEYFQDVKTSFETYLNQTYSIHFNMFLVHIKVFKEWFNVLKDGYKVVVSMIEDNFHKDFDDIENIFYEKEKELTTENIFDQKRIYGFVMEVFSGYSFFYISNGWSSKFKYVAAKFFGFDKIKENTKKLDL